MPYTTEQKRKVLLAHGVNPDEYDIDEVNREIIKKPVAAIDNIGDSSGFGDLPQFKQPVSDPSGGVETTVGLQKKPGVFDSIRRGATEAALPTTAGLLTTAGILALTPEPVVSKLTAGVLALLGGMGASIGASKLQREVVPEGMQQDLFLRPEDYAENKYSSILSGFIPGALAMRPSLQDIPDLVGGIKNLPGVLSRGSGALTTPQTQALINAGVNTLPSAALYGLDVAQGNREFDVGSLLAETLPGLTMTRPTGVGRALGFTAPQSTSELLAGQRGRLEPVDAPEPVVKPAPRAFLPEESLSTIETRARQDRMAAEESVVPPSRVEIKRRMVEEQQAKEFEENRQSNLRKAAFQQAEAEAEIAVQKAEATRIEAERLKKQNEAEAQKLMVGDNLQKAVEANRLAGEETRPVVNEEVEAYKMAKSGEVTEELSKPLSEGEQIQEEYDRGVRYSKESDIPKLERTTIESLNPEDRAKIKKEIERVARLRRQKVQYVDSLKDSAGKEVLGQYDPKTRTFKLNKKLYAGDTAPHETSHGRILDLLESTSKADQNLVLRGLEFADPKGRKFKTVEDYKKLDAAEQIAIEEGFAKSVGPEGYRRQLKELYGGKRERFTEWVKQIGNHFKVKMGTGGSDELYSHFVERQMFDAPDALRAELSGAKTLPAVGNLEKRSSEESDLPPPKIATKAQPEVMQGIGEQLSESTYKAIRHADSRQQHAKTSEEFSEDFIYNEISKVLQRNKPEYNDNRDYAELIAKGEVGEAELRKNLGDELADEVIELRDNLTKQHEETIGGKFREAKEATDKAQQKADEQHAFLRKDVERNQEESDLPPVGSNPPASRLGRIFSSATKAVRNLGGDTASHAADKAEAYFAEKSLNEGLYSNTIKAEITSYPKDVRERVDQYGREMMESEGKNKPFELDAQEQSLYDSIREYLLDIKDVNTAREIKANPHYWPAILSTEVASKWSKNPNSPEGRYYQNEWLKHARLQVKKGRAKYTEDELHDILDDYMAAVSSEGREASLTFGALRKAAGLGLPISMQDNNLLSRFGRYGNRVAKDLAFSKHIENDPAMRYLMRIEDPNTGKVGREIPNLPNGNAVDPQLRGAKPLQNVQKFMYEEFSNNQYPRIQALSRLVNSMLLGTTSGVRDIVTSPLNISAVIGPRNQKLLAEGFKNFSTSMDESYKYGARKIRMNELEFGSAASPDTLTRWFNEVADAFRKYSGRESMEQYSRAYMWGVAKASAVAEFGRAKNGNKTSVEWLKKYGNTVDNLDSIISDTPLHEISEDTINRIASNVVQRAAGTYDARGLPTVVMDGPLAPFFSLSRWSIEKANTLVDDVISPARQGNLVPLLSYTLGSFLTGAAIQQLNQLMSSGKRGVEPTLDEAVAADEQHVRAIVNLMQLGSFGGIIGEMMKSATELAHGHQPRGLSFPLADFVSETLGENLSDYFGALKSGEDSIEASLGLIERILVGSIQTLRVASYATWNNDEIDRKNSYRDYRLWQEMTGRREPQGSITRPNELINKEEKEFKRAKTLDEAGEALPKAVESILKKAGKNPLEVIKGFENLKRNSYQTWPTDEVEQVAYYEYLRKSQGEKAASEAFVDFLKQREVNKAKNELVPDLR